MRISDWSSDVCSSDLIGGPVVAQLVDLVGNRDALVGGDPFEHAHPLLEPLGMRRILRCLFGGLHALDFHLTLLELQPALEHVTPDAEHHGKADDDQKEGDRVRSEEHTSELQSLMRISYAVFCLKKKHTTSRSTTINTQDNTN